MTIGFIGFGEASSCIAKGLLEHNGIDIFAYDVNYERALQNAGFLDGVKVVKTVTELLQYSSNIIVAVPGKVDCTAFEEVYASAVEDYLFMDLSTALPEDKAKISKCLEVLKAKYVDVAVMGSVPKLLHRTPMLISGSGCVDMMSLFKDLYMDISICGDDAGKASTVKLCRSVFMKGLPALLIETKRVCQKYDVEEVVFESIYKNLEGQSFEMFAQRLIDGANLHCVRQRDELEECLEIEKQAGAITCMTEAAIDVFDTLIEGKKNE